MAVPGTKPQNFETETAIEDTDLIPYEKEVGPGAFEERNIVPGDMLSSRGALTLQGDWNADTNTPTLVASTGTKAETFRVSVAGATNLDGITSWEVNDLAYFDGSVWRQSQSGEVSSVFARTGPVVAVASDYNASQVDNDSNVAGTFVSDALNTLDAQALSLPTVGTGGDFANLQIAVTASVFKVKFISDVFDFAVITPPLNQDVFVDLNGFNWDTAGGGIFITTGTGSVQFVGDGTLTTLKAVDATKTFLMLGTGTFDITGFRKIDTSANTGVDSGFYLGNSAVKVIANNLEFTLSNTTGAGFDIPGIGSIFSNINVIGTGTTCAEFIADARDITISNISFSGTFNAAQANPVIDFGLGSAGSIISNITNSGTNFWITGRESNSRFTNIQDNINIDLEDSSDSRLTDIKIDSFDMSDVNCNNHSLKGVGVANAVTIGGDGNRGTANKFTDALTINGDNNHFFLTSVFSLTDNGTDNFVTNSAAEGGVSSVFTRKGDVVAVLNDYDASQINNDSDVTGDTVKEALDNLEAGGALQQTRAFWQGLAGDDSSTGASEDTPKLTLASMITAVGTPTASTPVEMTMIGGQVNAESFTIPPFTTLIARGCEFTGAITMSDQSKIVAHKVEAQASQTSFFATGAITCFIELDELVDTAGVNQTLIVGTSGAIFRVKIGFLSSLGTGTSEPWDLNTGSVLIMNTQSFKGINPGINIGGALVFHYTLDGRSSGESLQRNDSGGHLVDIAGDYLVKRNGAVNFDVTDSGTRVDTINTFSGTTAPIPTGTTAIALSSFPATAGTYTMSMNELLNANFSEETALNVTSDAIFTTDNVYGNPTINFSISSPSAGNLRLSIFNTSGFTLTFRWSMLRLIKP